MKTLSACVLSISVLASGVTFAVPASATTLTTPTGISISWDETKVFQPTGCQNIYYTWVKPKSDDYAKVQIVNVYGDTIGTSFITSNAPTGEGSIQVCRLNDYTGTEIVLEDRYNDSIARAPITFLSRTPAPAPVATPAPTPTAKPKTVKCISKKTFKKQSFKGAKCPKGWVRI